MDGPNLSPNPEKLNFFKIEPTDRSKIPNFKNQVWLNPCNITKNYEGTL